MTTPHPEDMPEREAFEAWYRRMQPKQLSYDLVSEWLRLDEDGRYDGEIHTAWEGWQARASLAEQRTRAMREKIVWSTAGYNKELAVDATGKVRGEVCEHSIDPRWDARANDARLGEYLNRDQAKAAVLAALAPPSAPGNGEADGKDAALVGLLRDRARLDYLEEHEATVELVPVISRASEEPWRFRVGGRHAATHRNLRRAIDAAMAAELPPAPAQSGGQGNG